MKLWSKRWTTSRAHGHAKRRYGSRSRAVQVERLESRTPLAADVTAGLVHHWTFDETSGDIAADSAGDNDGELRNYGAAESKWVPGKIGGAISFNDADDLVITQTPITQDQYSFSFWLNQTGGGGFNPRLINPGDEDWLILWQFAGRGIHFSDSGVWDPQMATRNTWEHYAVTLDQATNQVEFYRSGVLVASGTYPDKAPPIKQWVMGHSGTLTHHVDTLQGMLDDMRVYDRILSKNEVQTLALYQSIAANPDAYSTREDVPMAVSAASGVMKNDSTAGTITRAVVDMLPSHGQLALKADGSFTYSPAKDWSGQDVFAYHLEAGGEVSASSTVSIVVASVNDPPSFGVVARELVVSDEQPQVMRLTGETVPSLTYPELLSNRAVGPATATDESSQSLTWSAFTSNPGLFKHQPNVDHRGTLTFTPAPNAHGTSVVTITVRDSGGTANGGIDTHEETFTVTVIKPHRWHNTSNAFDSTGDTKIVAGDALAVINYINAFGAGPVPVNPPVGFGLYGPPFLDVTGDNFIAAGDALAIINVINVGGVFPTPSLPGSATFVGQDQTTQGDWQANYGHGGYAINSSIANLPIYAKVSFTGGLTDLYDNIVASPSNDASALVKPGAAERINSAWVGDYGFTVNLNLTDGQMHRVALYMAEGPNDRLQQLEVLDANTGEVLDSRTLDDFRGGVYLAWNLRGNVNIRFSNLANGLNALLNGIFFD